MSCNYRDDPILGPILAYWIGRRGSRTMPCKRDIDPIEIPPKVLPHLQIIEVLDDGARFRYRLIGTALADAYGTDFSGKRPDELFADDRLNFIQNIYRTVYRSKAPLFLHNKYHTPKNVDLFAIRIYMPLSDDDVNVNYILGVLRFEFSALFARGTWGDNAQIDPSSDQLEHIEVDNPAPALAG
jgi:hypothetical protein